ncbi:MAG: DHA2 family efflux MFS transporter permease subunit [Steroidobacteraceae bacterium]
MQSNAQSRAALHRVPITISVMLASILQALDTTIASVALPRMGGALSATLDEMEWVLTSYIVAAAVMTPLGGWLANRYGRKRVLLVSVAGFTVCSALCGMTQSLGEIVVFRTLQGMAGAALVPLSQAVLLDAYPTEQHGRATALWGMGVLIGPIIGPTLGGWLTDHYSWRWVFYINVPFGLLCLAGLLTYMRESPRRVAPFDLFGFATLSLGIGALQIMLDRGQLLDWFSSTQIVVEAGVAALAFYLFFVHSFTARHPFVNLRLFRDRNFAVGNLFIFVIGVVIYATLALLPPMLQDLMGYSVTLSGVLTSPRGVGAFITMAFVGRLFGRVDTRVLVALGLGTAALALSIMCRFSLQMDDHLVIWGGFLQGIGTGLAYVPLAAVSFVTLAPQLRNEGTAIFNLMRNVGSSIGISVMQALLTRHTQIAHASLAGDVSRFSPAVHALRSTAPVLDPYSAHGLAMLNQVVTRQASMIAYLDDFKTLMVLTLMLLPLVLLLHPARSRPRATAAALE